MIEYIKHKDIDRIKWDAAIDRALNRNLYAYTWYLDLVCAGWDALIEDDYVSVMPVTKGRRFFFNYVYQPMFTQQLGVFSEREITQSLVNSFLKLLAKKFNYIELNLNYSNLYVYEGFTYKEMSNYELNLDRSFLEIRGGYKQNNRWQVKQLQLCNLTIEKTKDVHTTIDMFRKTKGHIYTNLKTKNYSTLKYIATSLLELNKAEVWHVKDENGAILVGAFFFKIEDRIVFSFSGRTEEAREKKIMYFLCDKVLEEFSNKKITFDFAGSNDKGVAGFYRSFGAKEKRYLRITRNNLPFYIKWLKR